MIAVRRVVVALLLAGLAVVGLGAPPARADGGTQTLALGVLCGQTATNGLVRFDEASGSVTIDVDKLDESVGHVVIAANAASKCLGEITSLNWVGARHLDELVVADDAFYRNFVNKLVSVSFPASLDRLVLGSRAFGESAPTGSNQLKQVTFPVGLTSLTIGDGAFQQTASSGGNALTSVEFPEGLASLSIGDGAFKQTAGPGWNTLATVSFPASLTTLSIGAQAFRQDSDLGPNALAQVDLRGSMTALTVGGQAFYQYSKSSSNSLSSVSFPAGLDSLILGAQSFGQSADQGANALSSVSFPSGLTSLDIRDQVFWEWSGATGTHGLETVRIPGGLTTLVIGQDAFRQAGGATATLARVILDQSARRDVAQVMAVGDNAFAGTAPTWYWFGPDATNLADAWNGDINGTYFTRPTLLGYRTLAFDASGGSAPSTWYVYPVTRGVGHVDEPKVLERAQLGSTWSVALPTASRPGYSLFGWCPSVSGLCLAKKAGSSYTLAAASQTLHARWMLDAPVLRSSLPEAVVGTPYSSTVATGAELTCSVTSGDLPAGLSLSGCVLSGTPVTAGTASFTVTASNSEGSPSQALTLTVRNAPPVIATAVLPSAKVTVPYSAQVGVSGGGAITCSVSSGALPPGLALTGCALSGTPTRAGSYAFTVAASNDGGTGTKAYSLVVAPAKKFTKVYKPTISGKAKVGRTLKAKVKTWKPKPATVSWQWYRNGVAIPGATRSTYTLTAADRRAKLKVTVVRTRVGYLSSATSKSTARVR